VYNRAVTSEQTGGHRLLPVVDSGEAQPVVQTQSIPPDPSERRQEPGSLAELLDLNAFRELCTSFVDLYKIGIKIFDKQGLKLVDVRVGNGDWCGYIFQNTTGRGMCTNLVQHIKQHDYAELGQGQTVEQMCFSGLKYVITPIVHGGELLGRVIYGPFMPAQLVAPSEEVNGFGQGFDPHKLWSFGVKIRRVPDETVQKIITNFRQVVDTVIAIAIKAVLTEQLHLESVTASYQDLAETNRALRQSVERLKDVDRMKANFLAMISHELRTPLTSIIGYSEMLLEGMAGDLKKEQNEFVGVIKEKGESLLDLISAILEISKIESGALQLLVGQLDVAEMIRSAVRTVLPEAQKKRLEIKVELAPEVPPLEGDRDKLGRSVLNLLVNAVKFTPAGGYITVRAGGDVGPRRFPISGAKQREERFVRIEVADTGIGIPADKLNDVFRAFYQVDNSFTREYGGTGLGLAIVKSYVEAHGGEVWVESAEKVGTVFTLLIPLKVPEDSVLPHMFSP
jgi:signal transduction histidine kinase